LQAQVLIIEDESELAGLMTLYLNNEGIMTTVCNSAEQAIALLDKLSLDLVILDINLPGKDGFEFLQEFRRNNSTPVIIVSARETDEDIIIGLGIGADEYVNKPFAPKVLMARVRAILRRSRQTVLPNRILKFLDFELDIDGFMLKKAGKRLSLSVKEFEVLAFLAENKGVAYTPEQIYENIWGRQFGDITAVGVYVLRLRKKIEPDQHNPLVIQTIHGKGYRFNPEIIRN
jgi:two-component system response regulator RegX3